MPAPFNNPADQAGVAYQSISSGNGTLTAAQVAGGQTTVLATSGATAQITPTAALWAAALPYVLPPTGYTYVLRVYNTNGGTLTLTGGTGVTINGTATIATNVWREYLVTIGGTVASPTVVMQNLGAGNAT
jgi:hypothetical protein